ncbi:hypothetical protein GCM10010391_70720 [Streptomyces anthocyanicus]|nr:hypothetical protein GCM10010391_70720 [Streptomyces anthocyanicus]
MGEGQADFPPFPAGQFDGAAEHAGRQAAQAVGEFGDDGAGDGMGRPDGCDRATVRTSAGALPGQSGRRGNSDRAPEGEGCPVFEEFATRTVRTGEASVFVRYGGEGPPLLLLHGHPRTSATWHRVAPVLVRRGFTVVCPDLRGYGRSRGPEPAADHAPHSKRAVAGDMAGVM